MEFDELTNAVERARARLQDNPTFIARQEQLGIERALAYKLAVTTGLRRGELASLTVGQLEIDSNFPHVRLKAADEKNRQGNSIPLRRDVADDDHHDGTNAKSTTYGSGCRESRCTTGCTNL